MGRTNCSDGPALGGHRLLVAALLAAFFAATPARAAAPGEPLLPDLRTLKPTEMKVQRVPGAIRLRLSNTIANRGAGPLEAFPSAESNDCDGDGDASNDRDAFQRVFLDANGDGVFTRGTDTQSTEGLVGCFRFHDRPGHLHWHFLHFARYQLFRHRDGPLVASGRKIGFCLLDNLHPFGFLPGSPDKGFYPGGCDASQPWMLEGLSVGWADIYTQNLPGQQIDVTELPRGRYCLTSTADPDGRFTESDPSNNTRRLLIHLNPQRLAVKPLGPCRPG